MQIPLVRHTIHLVNISVPFRSGIEDMTRPPSGILYVGGSLKNHGYEVVAHHIRASEIDECISVILADDSLLFVGFSLMTGIQVTYSARMSSLLKARNGNIVVVWGGIHPSLMPKECLDLGFVDYVVIGEGEITVAELSDFLAQQSDRPAEMIPGLSFVRHGHWILTQDRPFEKNLDNFRQDWGLVDPSKYVRPNGEERTFCFISSRGCPHDCGFCYNKKFNLRKWRCHSVTFTVDELRKINSQTGINSVVFDDDNFFTDRKRGLEILRRLKSLGITCKWINLRVDYISEDFLRELVGLGVETIFMGWESGNRKTLQKISKGFSPELILEKTRILSRFRKLTVDASAIVGFPWETEEDIRETLQLMLEMFRINPFRMNFTIGLYIPYPGSPILEEALERGFRFPQDPEGWSKFDILVGTMELPWVTSEKVRLFSLIDKYSKLLLVSKKSTPLMKFVQYAIALAAYGRLRTGIFVFPFEVWLTDLYQMRQLRRNQSLAGRG